MTGDCFRLCVSYVLGLPVDEMPVANPEFRDWFGEWKDYLRPFGLSLAWMSAAHPAPEGYAIATVKTQKGSHATVTLNGELVFNPPGVEVDEAASRLFWYVFTVLEPRVLTER